MKKILFVSVLLMSFSSLLVAQEIQTSDSPTLSQAFENPNPEMELIRLESIKSRLQLRLDELKSNPTSDPAEIMKVEGTINYINAKIESLQKEILSIQYANQQGMPVQGSMSDEEYQVKLKEWKLEQQNNTKTGDEQVKTTLTREEFDRLPKERQEKILGMPERYTILD